jgi:hypothetical protein
VVNHVLLFTKISASDCPFTWEGSPEFEWEPQGDVFKKKLWPENKISTIVLI